MLVENISYSFYHTSSKGNVYKNYYISKYKEMEKGDN